MNHVAAIVALCVVLGGLSVGYDQYLAKPPERGGGQQAVAPQEKQAQDFTFKDIRGNTHKLTDFKGRWVILDFWATWCAPCVVTFPSLMKFANDHRDQVVVIALSSDRTERQIKDFIAKQSPETKQQADLPNVLIALDEGMRITKDLYFVAKYPETILISPEQKMTGKLLGATDWQSAELVNWAKSALEKAGK